jgi:hypothetical protein
MFPVAAAMSNEDDLRSEEITSHVKRMDEKIKVLAEAQKAIKEEKRFFINQALNEWDCSFKVRMLTLQLEIMCVKITHTQILIKIQNHIYLNWKANSIFYFVAIQISQLKHLITNVLAHGGYVRRYTCLPCAIDFYLNLYLKRVLTFCNTVNSKALHQTPYFYAIMLHTLSVLSCF